MITRLDKGAISDLLDIVSNRIDQTSLVDEESKEVVLSIIEDIRDELNAIIDGAEHNEVFHRERQACTEVTPIERVEAYDIFPKESMYDENFKLRGFSSEAKEANVWLEYGLGSDSSINQ